MFQIELYCTRASFVQGRYTNYELYCIGHDFMHGHGEYVAL
jgi:hypothetical protein